MKKTIALVCAGLLTAVALTGCFGFGGGSGNEGGNTPGNTNPTGSKTESGLVGTWTLAAAYDISGEEYDVASLADQVKLVVGKDATATFYYFDDDPFPGSLERATSLDSDYAVDGYEAHAYKLVGSDSSYWEFAYILPNGQTTDSFVYLEVGPEGDEDSLYLTK